MPRFSGRLSKIEVDKNWTKKIDEGFQRLIKGAAKAFVREIIVHVPIWTGMARGSIKFAKGTNGFLLQYLNSAVRDSPAIDGTISGTKARPRFYRHPGRVNRVRKTPTSGGKYARYNFSVSRKVYRFLFRDDVVHFIINDFYGSSSVPVPWNATLKAREAFQQYIAGNAKRLVPNLVDLLVFRQVQLGK